MTRPVPLSLVVAFACAAFTGVTRADGEKEVATYPGSSEGFATATAAVIREDGRLLLVHGRWAALIDPASGKRTKATFEGVNKEDVVSLMPVATGKTILVTRKSPPGEPKPVSLFDAETGKELGSVKGEGVPLAHPYRSAVSPDGKHVAYTPLDCDRMILLDFATGKSADVVKPKAGLFFYPTFTPDGKLLAAVARPPGVNAGYGITLWDTEKWGVVRTFGGENEYVEQLALSQDGKLIGALVEEPLVQTWSVRVWSLETGKQVWMFTVPQNPRRREPFKCLTFGKQGKLLAVGTQSEVLLFDATTGKQLGSVGGAAIRELERTSGSAVTPSHLSLSADGKLLAVTFRRAGEVTKLFDISGVAK